MPTKSLLEGMDLYPDVEKDVEHTARIAYKRKYVDNLRTALIAALRVIDSYHALAKSRRDREKCGVYGDNVPLRNRRDNLKKELEAALQVFRKEGV